MTPIEQAFVCIMIPVVVALAYVAGTKRALEVVIFSAMRDIVNSVKEKENNAECKWRYAEICCNADCPVRADYCPTVDYPGVCRFEEREEKKHEQ